MSASVLLVDWYNTLSTSKFWHQWAFPYHPMNRAFQAIQARWVGVDRSRIASWMRGQLTSEQFNAALARDVGLDFDEMHAAFIHSCAEMRIDVPEACVSVRRIRDMGRRVYIATDNMDSFCRWTCPALGLEKDFDGVLSSHHVGFLKEDLGDCGISGFFKLHLAQRGIEPRECLLIDDSEATCRTASALGMQTHCVSGPRHAAAFLDALLQ